MTNNGDDVMHYPYPRNKRQALDCGARYYFTGEPCKNGQIAPRCTSNTFCICDICKEDRNSAVRGKKRERKPRTPEQKRKGAELSRRYHERNREEVLKKMRERNRIYYQRNKERIKKAASEYQAKNSEKRNAYKVDWAKRKAKEDPAFKMYLAQRRMLHRALGVAGQQKYKRTIDHLGYTSEDLVTHLERQFLKGMSWDNYGEWHIDHIVPIAELRRRGVVDPKQVNALANLRPMWAKDNMLKGGEVTHLI